MLSTYVEGKLNYGTLASVRKVGESLLASLQCPRSWPKRRISSASSSGDSSTPPRPLPNIRYRYRSLGADLTSRTAEETGICRCNIHGQNNRNTPERAASSTRSVLCPLVARAPRPISCHPSSLPRACSWVLPVGSVAVRPGTIHSNPDLVDLLLCCHAAVLLCCRVAVLPCCWVAVLPCCRVALLPCCRVTIMPCSPVAVLPCCRVAVIQCCCAAILPCCCAAVLPRCRVAVLLCCRVAVLLLRRVPLLQYCRAAVLP